MTGPDAEDSSKQRLVKVKSISEPTEIIEFTEDAARISSQLSFILDTSEDDIVDYSGLRTFKSGATADVLTFLNSLCERLAKDKKAGQAAEEAQRRADEKPEDDQLRAKATKKADKARERMEATRSRAALYIEARSNEDRLALLQIAHYLDMPGISEIVSPSLNGLFLKKPDEICKALGHDPLPVDLQELYAGELLLTPESGEAIFWDRDCDHSICVSGAGEPEVNGIYNMQATKENNQAWWSKDWDPSSRTGMRIIWKPAPTSCWALGDKIALYKCVSPELSRSTGLWGFGDSSVQNVGRPPEAGWEPFTRKSARSPPPSLCTRTRSPPVSPPGAPKGAPKGQFHLSRRMLSAAQGGNVEGMQQVRAACCTYACLVRS